MSFSTSDPSALLSLCASLSAERGSADQLQAKINKYVSLHSFQVAFPNETIACKGLSAKYIRIPQAKCYIPYLARNLGGRGGSSVREK